MSKIKEISKNQQTHVRPNTPSDWQFNNRCAAIKNAAIAEKRREGMTLVRVDARTLVYKQI